MSSAPTTTKTVLIVDDEEQVVRALSLRCEQLGLEVLSASDAKQALNLIGQNGNTPDLLLLDFNLPGADGLTLCEMLQTDDSLPLIPVILLTGYGNDEILNRCKRVGAHYVQKNVDAWSQIEAIMYRLFGIGDATNAKRMAKAKQSVKPKGKKILIIDDDPTIVKFIKTRFDSLGYQCFTAYSGNQGYWVALKEEPDLIVLDYKMPEGWGNTVLGKLKSNPLTRDVPVIIVSGMTDRGVQRDVLRLGAECWMNKPFEMADLIKAVQDRIG